MCGRYVNSRTVDELAEVFSAVPDEDAQTLEPDYNVAPTDPVAAVLMRRPRGEDGTRRGEPVRRLTVLRWGLVPSWAKDRRIGTRMINARLETAAEKPAFRRAFAARRCLLPADGYYEWTSLAEGPGGAGGPGRGRARKQPWLVRPADGSVLALAGLYEVWRDPAAFEAPLVWTSAVLTTEAVDEAGRVHDRMPMLVEGEAWGRWLDPDLDDADVLRGLLQPAMPGRLEVVPVSSAVNDVRSSGPELVRPVPWPDGGPDPDAGASGPPAAVRLDDAPTLF